MTAEGIVGGDPTKLNLTGGTLTGPLVLSGDPTAALQPTTKQYTDVRDLNAFRPADHGFVGWSQDPATCSTTSLSITAGELYLIRIPTRHAVLLSTAWAIASTITGNPTLVELSVFTPDGQRRAITTNVAASWTSGGVKSNNFGSAYTTDPANTWVWLGILQVGGTISLVRASSVAVGVLNPNLTAATARWANAGTGLSSTPSSITPASNVLAATGEGLWGALS